MPQLFSINSVQI